MKEIRGGMKMKKIFRTVRGTSVIKNRKIFGKKKYLDIFHSSAGYYLYYYFHCLLFIKTEQQKKNTDIRDSEKTGSARERIDSKGSGL